MCLILVNAISLALSLATLKCNGVSLICLILCLNSGSDDEFRVDMSKSFKSRRVEGKNEFS